MCKIYKICFVLILFMGPALLYGQNVTARVAGLENNAKYMDLLRQEQSLRRSEDSIVRVIDGIRKLFNANLSNTERETQSVKVIQLEKDLFELRNRQGIVANDIGAIEQDFVFKNLNNPTPVAQSTPKVSAPPAGSQQINLIRNSYFKENLAAPDYKALSAAQQQEQLPFMLCGDFMKNYHKIDSLTQVYDTTASKAIAEECYVQMGTLRSLNQAVEDSLSRVWNYIYDNKTYAYNYLLDKMGKTDILRKFDQQFRQNSQQIVSMQDSVMSGVIYGYGLNKELILTYEETLAGLLGYSAARDSVTKQKTLLKEVHFDHRKVPFRERVFIPYGSIERSTPSKYNAAHPIPEMETYRQGTVYRIAVGSFSQKQGVAIFRGVSPLCWERTPEGRYRYYAGAFQTASEADAALNQLKTWGFRKPELVVWRDGVYQMLEQGSVAPGGDKNSQEALVYRVEISGQGANINPDIQKITQSMAPGKELARTTDDKGNYLYSIGSFDKRETADALCDAINHVAPGNATVTQIEH